MVAVLGLYLFHCCISAPNLLNLICTSVVKICVSKDWSHLLRDVAFNIHYLDEICS